MVVCFLIRLHECCAHLINVMHVYIKHTDITYDYMIQQLHLLRVLNIMELLTLDNRMRRGELYSSV